MRVRLINFSYLRPMNNFFCAHTNSNLSIAEFKIWRARLFSVHLTKKKNRREEEVITTTYWRFQSPPQRLFQTTFVARRKNKWLKNVLRVTSFHFKMIYYCNFLLLLFISSTMYTRRDLGAVSPSTLMTLCTFCTIIFAYSLKSLNGTCTHARTYNQQPL